METNQNNLPAKQNYYTSKKRKVVDFLIGNFLWVMIFFSVYILSNSYMDLFGFPLSLFLWGVCSAIVLFYKRKFIFWGMIALPVIPAILIPLLMASCSFGQL